MIVRYYNNQYNSLKCQRVYFSLLAPFCDPSLPSLRVDAIVAFTDMRALLMIRSYGSTTSLLLLHWLW